MKVPPLLLSCAVLFWGMESGYLIIGVIMGAGIGSVTIVNRRWDLSDSDFAGISDFTSVIFIVFIAVILQYEEEMIFLKALVIWLPLILSPLIVAQLYTDKEKIVIGTRIGSRKKKRYQHSPIDFRCYYLLTCLFSAAVANSRSMLFFPVTAGVIFILLWVNRGRSAPLYAFLTLCVVASAGGYIGSRGGESVHDAFRNLVRQYIRGYFSNKYADPFLAHLSFGHIGEMKASGKIILRVEAPEYNPGLLKIASYETYNRRAWHSSRQFDYLPPIDSGWDLLPPPHAEGRAAMIEYVLPKKKGLLPQPYGSFRVEGTTIYELDQKSDGITRILDGEKFAAYTIFYNKLMVRKNDRPTPRSLVVHPDEKPLVRRAVEPLALDGMTGKQRIDGVKKFFADGFFYSLQRTGKGDFETPLENFLFGTRAGYCEMFATATTLMLREVGIPSRYVTGFIVAEYSGLEGKYIVRERHAHAWSEAFIDNSWTVVDTTPAQWLEQDAENSSGLEYLRDLLSYLRYLYDSFMLRAGQDYKHILLPSVIILSAILSYSIYRRMKFERREREETTVRKQFGPLDSPFYAVEERLVGMMPRFAGENFYSWVERFDWPEEDDFQNLLYLYRLHLKLRFDPAGLDEKETVLLTETAESSLVSIEKME